MGYETSFEGEITVRPALPASFVSAWADWCSGEGPRNGEGFGYGIPRDAEGIASRLVDVYDTAEYIEWEITQADDGRASFIQHDGGEKFYEYGSALQYLVDCIRRLYPYSTFAGAIDWSGEEPGDLGTLTVDAEGIVHEDSRAIASGYTDVQLTALVAAAVEAVDLIEDVPGMRAEGRVALLAALTPFRDMVSAASR